MTEEEKEMIKSHTESFPKMESHYCRKDTKLNYFTADLTNQMLYNLYEEKCEEDGVEPKSKTTCGRVFGMEFNIGFYNLRKDQRATCARYQLAEEKGELEQTKIISVEGTKHRIRRDSSTKQKQIST